MGLLKFKTENRKGKTIMHTTLNQIYQFNPCQSSWSKLLSSLGKTTPDDEPLEFRTIYDILNATDLLWSTRVLNRYLRIYLGARFAETALQYTDDECVHNCVAMCFKYVRGEVSKQELDNAAEAVRVVVGGAAAAVDASAGYAAGLAARVAERAVSERTGHAAHTAAITQCAKIMLDCLEKR